MTFVLSPDLLLAGREATEAVSWLPREFLRPLLILLDSAALPAIVVAWTAGPWHGIMLALNLITLASAAWGLAAAVSGGDEAAERLRSALMRVLAAACGVC